jgi:ABC-type glycerol-3-phosphate transport system permease component
LTGLGRIGPGRLLLGGGLGVLALVMLFPLYWMLVSALKTPAESALLPPTLWPHDPRPSNFVEAWAVASFWRYLANSLLVAAGTVVGVVACSTLAGFAFAKYRFPGRSVLFGLLLATLMVPGQVTAIPLYLELRDLGLLNQHLGVILPALAGGFGTFLLRQYFTTVPDELLDAARIDGASELRIFWQIVLPQAGPAVAALVIFTFMASWDAFFWPLIVLSSPDRYTLPVGVALFRGQFTTNQSYLMAVSFLTTLPVLAVFLAAQRRFVQGIALTGLK